MPLPTESAPWNFYRLGLTREKELFKRRRDTYSGVVIPAHIASYYAKFCTEFIGSLQKPYFIDPITYIFARRHSGLRRYLKDPETGRTVRDDDGKKQKGGVKRSVRKIVAAYGELINGVVAARRPLQVSDFEDDAPVEEFVSNVVTFQRSSLAALPTKFKKYAKFARLVGREFQAQNNPPFLLVAPYFYIDESKWIPVNIDLIKRTKRISQDIPVFAAVAAPLDRLESSGRQMVERYKASAPDGFLLWIDGFTGTTDLHALGVARDFVKELSALGKPVVALYGDAYCLVLKHFGLTGFACGICYGEKRSVDQDTDVEGQIPPFYYLSALKKKIQIETELKRRNPRSFASLTCPCELCEKYDDLVQLDEMGTREHFMLSRAMEVELLREGQTAKEMAKELREAYEEFKHEAIYAPVQHLNNWSRLLTET